MILSDHTIREYIECGFLCDTSRECNSHVLDNIQPASLDITLDRSFRRIQNSKSFILNVENEIEYQEDIVDNFFIIEPKQFVLASTVEYINLPNFITAFVEGRSSIGRIGLFIQNAGWVDPGFEGQITLELFNASDYKIMLKPNMRIGQLVFAKMDKSADTPYDGKYQGQIGATGSMLYKDFT